MSFFTPFLNIILLQKISSESINGRIAATFLSSLAIMFGEPYSGFQTADIFYTFDYAETTLVLLQIMELSKCDCVKLIVIPNKYP